MAANNPQPKTEHRGWFDRLSGAIFAALIFMNGYRLAAVFLAIVFVSIVFSNESILLDRMLAKYPLFSQQFWVVVFGVCTYVVGSLDHRRFPRKLLVIVGCFILPVTLFFGSLLTLGTAPPSFFVLGLVGACIYISSAFILRTEAIDIHIDYTRALEQELEKTKKELSEARKEKEPTDDAGTA